MSRRPTQSLIIGVTALALAAAACSSGNSSGSSGGGKTVTVGESTTLSGSIAELGQTGMQGVQLAVDDLNAKGGVLGKTIKVVSADDAAKPATGTANVRNMILNDKVSAIFGPVSSAVAAAEKTLAAQYKTPIFFHTSNDIGLMTTSFTKYAFQVVPNTTMEPRAVAAYLAKQAGGKQITVATFAPDYSFGHHTVEGFLAALKALNVDYKLVDQQFPPLGETNIAPYLSKLVAASPQYVFNVQFGGDLVTFTKQANGYGFFKKTTAIAMFDFSGAERARRAGAGRRDRLRPGPVLGDGVAADLVQQRVQGQVRPVAFGVGDPGLHGGPVLGVRGHQGRQLRRRQGGRRALRCDRAHDPRRSDHPRLRSPGASTGVRRHRVEHPGRDLWPAAVGVVVRVHRTVRPDRRPLLDQLTSSCARSSSILSAS